MYGQIGLEQVGNQMKLSSFTEIPSLSGILNINLEKTSCRSRDFTILLEEIPDSEENLRDIALIVGLSIGFTTLILLLLFLVLFYYLKKKSKKEKRELLGTSVNNIELEESNVQVSQSLVLGSNRIWKGKYTGKDVAVKKLLNDQTELNFYQFINSFYFLTRNIFLIFFLNFIPEK